MLESARATCSGSRTSTAPRGWPVVTAQKRQPRVQVSPRSITVAVPSPQHSPTLGQRASSQTVCRSSLRNVSFSVRVPLAAGRADLEPGRLRSEAGGRVHGRRTRASPHRLARQPGERALAGGRNLAALGEDGADEARGGDVERRVVCSHAGRGHRVAASVSTSRLAALLDGDGAAVRAAKSTVLHGAAT